MTPINAENIPLVNICLEKIFAGEFWFLKEVIFVFIIDYFNWVQTNLGKNYF